MISDNTNEHITYFDSIPEDFDVDFTNPIHIAPDEYMYGRIARRHSEKWG